MIKDNGSKFDDYSILPKIRHFFYFYYFFFFALWRYELTEKLFFY